MTENEASVIAIDPQEEAEINEGIYEKLLTVGEECVSAKELKDLISSNAPFNAYDGFEPSGRMHIAQGVYKARNVNKLIDSGRCTFLFWVADWFALMNDKMGGDLEAIKTVGKYLIEVWRASGMRGIDTGAVEFLWASKSISEDVNYFARVYDISRRFNLTRVKKCCQIMGRKENTLSSAQILYPLMQCADVFFLKANICQLGLDQRKVNMLAREYADSIKMKKKPIILSHHMLAGLKKGQAKMSKSDPDSAIFMEDSAEDVQRKIEGAYCPPLTDDDTNPCLEYVQHILFSEDGFVFTVPSNSKEYTTFESLKTDYANGTLSEVDLKAGLIYHLNLLLDPVREHFTNDPEAFALLQTIKDIKKKQAEAGVDEKTELIHQKVNEGLKNQVVIIPDLPNTQPTLHSLVNLVLTIREAQSKNPESSIILYLSNFSSLLSLPLPWSMKEIDIHYNILSTAIPAVDALLSTTSSPQIDFDRFKLIKQNEIVYCEGGSSDYFLSLMNAGRALMLGDLIQDLTEAGLEDGDISSSHVIARLMHIADVLALQPKEIAYFEPYTNNTSPLYSILQLYSDKEALFQIPTLCSFDKKVDIQLQEGVAVTDNHEYFLFEDPKLAKSKLKKAFCEPGNLSFCPPIALASVFVSSKSENSNEFELIIKRKEENGGNLTYKDISKLTSDFESGALHPGDLKAAVGELMLSVIEKLKDKLKDCAKEAKAFKQLEKKMKKKK